MSVDTTQRALAVGARRIANPASTMVLLGDSVTKYCGPEVSGITTYIEDWSWFGWLNAKLGQPWTVVNNAGVAGERSDQILARVGTDVLPYRPGWCFVMCGVNDIWASKTPAEIFANLQAIVRELTGAGIRVIVSTITPDNGWTGSEITYWWQYNQMIRDWARTEPNVTLTDMARAVVDATSNTYITNANRTGGTHPSAYGAYLMAQAAYDDLKYLAHPFNPFSLSSADVNEIITNPFQTGTAGAVVAPVTGTVADGWNLAAYTGSPSVAGSKVARTDGVQGEWQEIQYTAGGYLQYYTAAYVVGSKFAVGDTVRAVIEVQTNGDWANTQSLIFHLDVKDSGATMLAQAFAMQHDVTQPNLGVDVGTVWLQTPDIVLPANTNNIRPILEIHGGTGTTRVGRASLRAL